MSISSSLAAGVSGLQGNSTKLASISDNISNASTFGYKRSYTDFHSMVVDSGSAGSYTAGGVRTSTTRLVDQQGRIESSENSTDLAVNGGGFLPVTRLIGSDRPGAPDLSLMTTGSFRPNAEGKLVDAMGNVLLGVPARPDGSFPDFARDSSADLRPVDIYHNELANNPTTKMTLGLNLPASETDTTVVYDINMEYFGNQGETESVRFEFSPTANDNEWVMTVTDSATPAANNPIATHTLTFSDVAADGGTLDTVNPPLNADGTITLDINDGADQIALDIGGPGELDGITQLDTAFAPSTIEKNGSSVGRVVGVEVDPEGVVQAIYNSGFTRPIYQVPVIDVSNPNGLIAGDNQTYQVSRDSGALFMWDSGEGPVGEINGYAREASTVDVAKELTDLITTQRAYSSNAKVIQTVDEMLQETANLKR